MSSPLANLTVEQLNTLLRQKTVLYNDMIKQNKEFQEVKGLFMEIKDIMNRLSQLQDINSRQVSASHQSKDWWMNYPAEFWKLFLYPTSSGKNLFEIFCLFPSRRPLNAHFPIALYYAARKMCMGFSLMHVLVRVYVTGFRWAIIHVFNLPQAQNHQLRFFSAERNQKWILWIPKIRSRVHIIVSMYKFPTFSIWNRN